MRPLLFLALCLLIFVCHTSALTCLPCNQFECKPHDASTCQYGARTARCGCCQTCQNGPGDKCGGPWRILGGCAEGFECDFGDTKGDFNAEGICKLPSQLPAAS